MALITIFPSRGLPFTLEENSNRTDTHILSTKKLVQVFRDQERITVDERGNKIFHGNLLSGGENFIPSLEQRGMYCQQKAKCQHLKNSTCLGVKLPYSSSTTDLVALSREEVMVIILLYWSFSATLIYLH